MMKLVCLALMLLFIWVFGCCAVDASQQKSLHARVPRQSRGRIDLKVTSFKSVPFLMEKTKTNKVSTSGHDYEGFVVDLLELLSKELNFDYKIVPVRDGFYGSRNKAGEWNGMIGELLNNTADIAVADLTITEARKEAVQFSEPILTTGIGMVGKRPPPPSSPDYGSALTSAFSHSIWITVVIALFVFSVTLFILARLSGGEWVAVKTSSGIEQRNNLSLNNSLWFAIASLTLQNPRISPRCLSTRLLSAMWWIFCIAIVSLYIANVANILSYQRQASLESEVIRDVEDLPKQQNIRYGTIQGGSTNAFFRNSMAPLYQRIYANIQASSPSDYVKSNQEAFQRVLEGNYVAFLEAVNIEYAVERNCDLIKIGGVLDYKGYGIAFNPEYRRIGDFNQAIFKLQANGQLAKLKQKWWKEQRGGGQCSSDDKEEPPLSLSSGSLAGVLTLFVVGATFSFIIALVELFWKAMATSKEHGGSACNEVIKGLKFSVCGGESPNATRSGTEDGIVLQ